MAFEFVQICGRCGGTGFMVIPQGVEINCPTCAGVGSYVAGSMPDLVALSEKIDKILEIVEKA